MSTRSSKHKSLFHFQDSSLKRPQDARDDLPDIAHPNTSKRIRPNDYDDPISVRPTHQLFAKQGRSSASTPLPEGSSERHSSSLVDSDSDDAPSKSKDPARRRASSSLVSDRTDGEPYIPSKPGSPEPKRQTKPQKQEDSLFVPSSPQQQPEGRNTARKPSMDRSFGSRSSAAPLANMSPAFHINSPDPASVRPFPVPEFEVVTSNFKNKMSDDVRKQNDAARQKTVPMEDVRSTPIPGDDLDDKKNEKTAFYQIYGKLCKASQDQVGLYEQLHDEHQRDLKRTQNLASRRKQRVE